MKMNSAFSKGAFCPSCKKYVIGQGNVPDPPWSCVYCSAKICAYCFAKHTEAEHPEAYSIDIAVSYLLDGRKIAEGTMRAIPHVPMGYTLEEGPGEKPIEGEMYTIVDPNRVTPV